MENIGAISTTISVELGVLVLTEKIKHRTEK